MRRRRPPTPSPEHLVRFVAAEWIADGAMTEAEAMSAWLAARYLHQLDHPEVAIGDDVDLIRARAAWKMALDP